MFTENEKRMLAPVKFTFNDCDAIYYIIYPNSPKVYSLFSCQHVCYLSFYLIQCRVSLNHDIQATLFGIKWTDLAGSKPGTCVTDIAHAFILATLTRFLWRWELVEIHITLQTLGLANWRKPYRLHLEVHAIIETSSHGSLTLFNTAEKRRPYLCKPLAIQLPHSTWSSLYLSLSFSQ